MQLVKDQNEYFHFMTTIPCIDGRNWSRLFALQRFDRDVLVSINDEFFWFPDGPVNLKYSKGDGAIHTVTVEIRFRDDGVPGTQEASAVVKGMSREAVDTLIKNMDDVFSNAQ